MKSYNDNGIVNEYFLDILDDSFSTLAVDITLERKKFIDSLNVPKNMPFLKNKIIITQNNLQNYLMFEYNCMEKYNNQIKDITELNFKQIADLMILSDSKNIPKNLEEIMDKDTILSKNLGNNILYIEDIRKNIYIIITKNEKIVIEGRGLETNIKFYENNT